MRAFSIRNRQLSNIDLLILGEQHRRKARARTFGPYRPFFPKILGQVANQGHRRQCTNVCADIRDSERAFRHPRRRGLSYNNETKAKAEKGLTHWNIRATIQDEIDRL